MESRDETRKAAKGEPLTVDLPVHGTSGYQWQVTSPASVSVRRSVVPPSGDIGAAASERFEITPSRPGQSTVVFKLRRPWERKAIREHRIKLVTD